MDNYHKPCLSVCLSVAAARPAAVAGGSVVSAGKVEYTEPKNDGGTCNNKRVLSTHGTCVHVRRCVCKL